MQNLPGFIKKWYASATPAQKRNALLAGIGILATILFFALTGGNSSGDALEPAPLYFVGVAVKLIAVLLLIVGGAIILKRWQGRRIPGKPGRQLRLLETVRLSPKQALHVVELGGQHYLIGATDQNISLLSQVELDQVEASGSETPLDFNSIFSAMNNKPDSNGL
jgi:flagellar biosynthetic protein FliO